MITKVLESIPGPIKGSADVITLTGSVTVLADKLGFVNLLVDTATRFFGLLAVMLSLTWAALRLYEALTRRRHCAHRTSDCPMLCPPGCRYWSIKSKERGK